MTDEAKARQIASFRQEKARAAAQAGTARRTLESPDGPFDLVLIDINLGEGPNGKDVLSELRAMPAYRDVPIAAVTAYALPGDRETFLNTGFNAYLSMPFREDALRALVSNLLAHKPGEGTEHASVS